MTIRPATDDDRPAVVAMAGRFIESTSYRAWPPTAERLDELFNLAYSHGVILVADLAGELVGMLALVGLTQPLTGLPYAEELCWWVEPRARGGPAALRLLKAAEDYARQQGWSCLKMVQPADEPGVGKIYSRRGFRPVEVVFVKEW